MPIEGYRNDKEYISDYLRLISAGSNDNNIDDTPFSPLGVEEPRRKKSLNYEPRFHKKKERNSD